MKRKRTKIVATISDRRCEIEFIRKLYDEGMNVARLNTAHQSPADTLHVVENIRAVSNSIGIMIDTKGPEIRTRWIEKDIPVRKDDLVEIHGSSAPVSKRPFFAVSYDGFIEDVPIGAEILIDDGVLAMRVEEKNGQHLVCRIGNAGTIQNKRSVNVPGIHMRLPALSDKDREYVHFCVKHDIDFVAHSFVRNQKDLEELHACAAGFGGQVQIISKIENREGVDNIGEILKKSAGVMIARGDMGIEIEASEVPIIQKKIIRKCIKKAIPVITATQMLHTMIHHPRPTRAEVSDVANAIYDGTDAVMLSGETAYGDYPVEAVRVMASIARKVEEQKPQQQELPVLKKRNKTRNYLAKAAVRASLDLPVAALVIDTETGHSARVVSAYRGHVPVFAKTSNHRVVRALSLSYGVFPSFMEMPDTTDRMVAKSLTELLHNGDITEEDLLVILAGTPGHSNGSNFIEINTAALCLQGRIAGG